MAVPTYDLYGEDQRERPDYWLHCETIASRSSRNHWEIRRHRHERFQQFLYIRSGDCDATLGAIRAPAKAPCILLIPPGLEHGFRFSRDIDGIVVTISTDRPDHGRAWGTTDPISKAMLLSLSDEADAIYFGQTVSRLLQAYEQGGAQGRAAVTYLDCALHLLQGFLGSNEPPQTGSDGKARVEALRDLIGQNFRRHLSVEDYAEHLGLSSTHLNRLTRGVAGCSVRDLITTRLLEEAQRSLIFSASTVQMIAEQLGFSDSAYFCRWFRKQRSITPRQYRERARQGLSREAD